MPLLRGSSIPILYIGCTLAEGSHWNSALKRNCFHTLHEERGQATMVKTIAGWFGSFRSENQIHSKAQKRVSLSHTPIGYLESALQKLCSHSSAPACLVSFHVCLPALVASSTEWLRKSEWNWGNYAFCFFVFQKIDGKALLTLTKDQIIDLTGMKVGPSLKIYDLIQQLKIKINPAQERMKASLKKLL